ncbi:copper-transporting ATPase 2 [Eremomyces bilateralis CBS 781.70]|uniref:Copper-transporting ATPase 2 n=1 Tax=Eremomyces bilateralis CBS 781.70 TaxID=1392243 RepID=A0A6G1FRV0_9PEZI|nr:copper-transporting ATPase 2 [Eremomyces bilateralis CBS 781.70]KAF1808456.1 copper-transporting ATPase 2 [Eremomyces bilateralis CBS 781.70]
MASSATPSPSRRMATTTLQVQGMTCGACTSAVESAFANEPAVQSVDISLVMERAVLVHDVARIAPETIKDMIEDRGFGAAVISTMASKTESQGPPEAITTVQVGGMTCGACTSAIEGAFKDVEGVKNFSISLLSERAVLEHDPKLLAPEKIAEIIEDAGFEAKVIGTKPIIPTNNVEGTRRTEQSDSILSTTVAIEGMTCGACTSAVEGGFKTVDGMLQFNISLLAERAVIVHDNTKLSPERIATIIEDCGFDAKIVSSVAWSRPAGSGSSAVSLKIFGLSGEDDASVVEKAVGDLKGVDSVSVSYATNRATVNHTPNITGLRAIVEAIEKTGFNALLADSEDNNAQLESLAKTKEIQGWRRAFRISLCFAVPVFLISMIFPMWIPFLDIGSVRIVPGIYLGDIVCLILTIPVQFGIGRRFYRSAYKSLIHRAPTMDVLVVLGTSAAFFFSVAAMLVSFLTPPHTKPSTVFDTSTMLITFITLGRYMENSAKGQTSKALSRLMSLAPSMATIYVDPIAAIKTAEDDSGLEKMSPVEKLMNAATDNSTTVSSAEEQMVPTELLESGDVVVLRPGDKIPADGIVLRGESYVDESMVTGEAMPILKRRRHALMAGTVNGAGRLDLVVTRAGRDTQLSQIVRLVQDAQTTRAPIQRLADKVAGYFVPIIITLGLATFVAWMVLSHLLSSPPDIFLSEQSGGRTMVCAKLCISVIVIACPCALGLSTPTAVMVGTGVGASQGILVKGGAALEKATAITHVVLDKTGTLTIGKMSVSSDDLIHEYLHDEAAAKKWWTLVGLAETGSEHPIARAIVNAARQRLRMSPESAFDGSITDFKAAVGKGLSATCEAVIDGRRVSHRVHLGNASYLRSQGVVIPVWASSRDKPLPDKPLPPRPNSPYSDVADLTSTVPNTPTTPAFSRSLSAGTSTIHTALDVTYTGSLSLADTLKPTARAAIAALRRLGVTCSIVTGDTLAPALVVARAVGIPDSNVHASASPSKKQALLQEMKKQRDARGRRQVIAMVGDGINDSPALATADIGIALAEGADIAMEAASIVLMASSRTVDLLAIPASLHLSRAIFRRIKLNLLWATMYNAVGLPFAMGLFLPWGLHVHPMAAGAAMAASSVSVVASSLALRWWRRPRWMCVEVLDPEGAGFAGLDGGEVRKGRWMVSKVLGNVKRWMMRLVETKERKRLDESQGTYVPLREMDV